MNINILSRVALVVLFLICAALLVRAIQQVQAGNTGPLVLYVASAFLGAMIVWALSRRR